MSTSFLDDTLLPSYPLTIDDLCDKNDRLLRLLRASERKYAVVFRELEEVRDALGYYKTSLPFLQFPREVRDQIYTYALQAPVTVFTQPIVAGLVLAMPPYKPPTPAMVLVNSQLYHEGNVILYSKNTFTFRIPRHMLEFLHQIGTRNKHLIQSIAISVNFTTIFYSVDELDELAGSIPDDKDSSGWANAIIKSELKNLSNMHVLGEDINPSGDLITMDPVLEDAIKVVLRRNQAKGVRRKLTLKGFTWDEWKKFPEDWEVTITQWDEPDSPEERSGNSEPVEEWQGADQEWGSYQEDSEGDSDSDSDVP